MAGSITLALEAARSGLMVNQAALNIVANNIANVNTPGYSRKIADQSTRLVNGEGAGVELANVSRKVDEGLLKSLRIELASTGELGIKESYFDRLQELFGSPADNSSISHIYASFLTAIESLAVSPDKTLDQTEVVRRGEELTQRLQDMSSTIQELRRQADIAIAAKVTIINELSSEIGDLNDKIVRNSSVNLDVSDIKDQRDQLLDQLSELIDVRYFTRQDGDIVVFTSNGTTLVDNIPVQLNHNPASTVSATATQAQGGLGGIYTGAAIPQNDITNLIRGGTLKGLIDLRDNILPNLQSQIDELAAETRDAFNRVHNRGVSFPGAQDFTGTRTFVRPSVQTMTLDPANGIDDVTIALMDSTGAQQAVTTLETIMTSASFGSGAQSSNGPWTITEIAASVEDWLQANGATGAAVQINAEGNFTINVNNTNLFLSFRDQETAANGANPADVSIGFDADGDGNIDQTISGFANFLGLNDFFVTGLSDNIYETNVLSSTFTSTAASLTFTDNNGSLGSVAIAAGSTLEQMAAAINLAGIDVTASVIPDGSGKRLRITHSTGKDMTITQASGNSLLDNTGMHVADVRVSTNMRIRDDIVKTPSKISRGNVQWDPSKGSAGEYFNSAGDDTVAQALASVLSTANSFDTSGSISGLKINFTDFAAAIVAQNSSDAGVNSRNLNFQQVLTESLQAKSDNVRGVNLDEEMAQLILLEQAYSAAARLITVIQRMFETLNDAVR